MIHTMYRIPLSIPVGNQDHHKGATTKRTVSEGPSHDILVQVGHSRLAWLREVSSKFLARHSDNRSVGSAVDDIAKSTNFHHQLQPLLK